MAEKKKPTSAKVTTRVVASTSDTKKSTKKAAPAKTKAVSEKVVTNKKSKQPKEKKQRDNYFVGAWRELRQVRWPDRKATWSLTFAVIVYSIFFFVLIILLDALFKYLFADIPQFCHQL